MPIRATFAEPLASCGGVFDSFQFAPDHAGRGPAELDVNLVLVPADHLQAVANAHGFIGGAHAGDVGLGERLQLVGFILQQAFVCLEPGPRLV